MHKIFHSLFVLHIFVTLIEKEPFTQFYGRFDRFSQAYKVPKFLIDLIVSHVVDVIHANEHTYIMLTVTCKLFGNFD